jgi:hypothetical protein
MVGSLDGWMEVGHVFSLYNFGVDRLGVTFSHSSYSILCLSVAVGTCVNFTATVWFYIVGSSQRPLVCPDTAVSADKMF